MAQVQFAHREPIGSSTFPMPGEKPNSNKFKGILASPERISPTSTLYIHIPFCDQICSFCGFNKAVSSEDVKERYVRALIAEIQMYARTTYVQSLDIRAVYLGGGTPNSLSSNQLARILRALQVSLPLSVDAEVTCEGIIQNFDADRIGVLKENGVNRVSAGIQTFDLSIRTEHLHMRNGEDELLSGIDMLRRSFGNFNLDFIYNLPKQTDEIWSKDVRHALASGSSHLTVYPLVLLENTIFYADYVKNKKYDSPDQEREISMYEYALDQVRASEYTERYSVRDWAKPGFECQYIKLNAYSHNILAFGAGAHGFLGGMTYRTTRHTKRYMEIIEDQGDMPIEGMRVATKDELMRRYAVMGLRMMKLDLNPFEARFGIRFDDVFADQLGDLLDSGYLKLEDQTLQFSDLGNLWGNNVRTYFEGNTGTTVGYSDTTSIGSDGKTHYSQVSRVKAAGDVEANV